MKMENEKAVAARQPVTVKDLLSSEGFKKSVAQALPSHIDPDRYLRIAITAVTTTPLLQQCTQASLYSCLMDLSQMGLEPDGYHAYLIPFKNGKTGQYECQYIIDYKGLVDVAMRSGQISNIHADVVCENDEFSYNMGTVERHVPAFLKTPPESRGKVIAAYAIATFKDGSKKAEILSNDELEGIRKRSKAGDFGPWKTDTNEMKKKTAFRRLSKWLPMSPEFRQVLTNDLDRYPDIHARVVEPERLAEAEDLLLGPPVEMEVENDEA